MYEHSPYSTSSTTPAVAATEEISDGMAGMIKVDVIGLTEDGAGLFTTSLLVAFVKIATLTLGTPTVIHTSDVLGGNSVDVIVDADENLAVEVTGTADVTNWIVWTEFKQTNVITMP